MRFTNRAATFDHSTERTHEFCWEVPQPGRGTDIWIPLAINPAQRNWWDRLLSGDATAGQLQLVHQSRHDRWELHVPLTLPTPDTEINRETYTPVGVDGGEAILLTGCALRNGRPVDPSLVDGGRARELHQTLQTTLQRLQERDAAAWRIDERAAYFRNALGDEIEGLFEDLFADFAQPGAEIEVTRREIEGEVAYIVWRGETPDNDYEFATDTFVVRGGAIRTQTFAGRIEPKE